MWGSSQVKLKLFIIYLCLALPMLCSANREKYLYPAPRSLVIQKDESEVSKTALLRGTGIQQGVRKHKCYSGLWCCCVVRKAISLLYDSITPDVERK